MVVTSLHPRNLLRAFTIAVVAALIAMTAVFGTAAADPDNSGGGGTYGFDSLCQGLHDTLDGIGFGPFNLGNLYGGECKAGNALTHPGDAANAIVDKAWDSTFGKIVDSLVSGLGEVVAMSIVWWIKFPNANLANSPGLFSKIRDYTYELQIYVLIASVLVSAFRIARARRRAAGDEVEEVARVFTRSVFANTLFSALIVCAATAGDKFSSWIVDDATNGNAKGMAESMLQVSSLQAFSAGLILILAILGILGAIAQLVFAVVRQGLLIVAVGMLPLAAAGSAFKTGESFYNKLLTWTIAFLLWKPVAALVYMIAFTTAGTAGEQTTPGTVPDADTAQRVLVGMVLLCSTGILLPAVMRLASPIAVTASRGGGGMLAMAGAMALRRGRIPTGAKSAPATKTPPRSGGSGGGGNNRPPTGTGPAPSGSPGPRGPAGPKGTPGSPGKRGPQGSPGKIAALSKAAGPIGVGVAVVGAGAKAAHGTVSSAATAHGAPSTPRPTGTGRARVPR